MKRLFERYDQPVEANLRKAYRAPPEGPEPHDFRKLLSRLKDAFEARQNELESSPGDTCH